MKAAGLLILWKPEMEALPKETTSGGFSLYIGPQEREVKKGRGETLTGIGGSDIGREAKEEYRTKFIGAPQRRPGAA